MLGWLTRLLRPRVEAEPAPTASPPPPQPLPLATPLPTLSDAAIQVAADDRVGAEEVEPADQLADQPADEPALLELAPVGTAVEAEKETCPTCGKTGVFAGPPGQRFCTYCALRDELFERAAVTE